MGSNPDEKSMRRAIAFNSQQPVPSKLVSALEYVLLESRLLANTIRVRESFNHHDWSFM